MCNILWLSLILSVLLSWITLCTAETNCTGGQFLCAGTDRCIPLGWRCDDDNDCTGEEINGKTSDEQNCESVTCLSDNHFKCHDSGKCMPSRWQCDGEFDCPDHSDEDPITCEAKSCKEDQFPCGKGLCIPISWKCDNRVDCPDRSDEENCEVSPCDDFSEFTCNNSVCINRKWLCDEEPDCAHGEDEQNCEPIICDDQEFKCTNSSACIQRQWVCDGDDDCTDKSDEANCPTKILSLQCSGTEFPCYDNQECIHSAWQCDGDNDCEDASDEICPHTTCRPDQFKCNNNVCISKVYQCNGEEDCNDGSDEHGCAHALPCDAGQFDCDGTNPGKSCIDMKLLCNGVKNCPNDKDESPDICKPESSCEVNNGGCQQVCTQHISGPVCSCRKGFSINDTFYCNNINECAILGTCSQFCSDTKGGYKCSCRSNYQLDYNNVCRAIGSPPQLVFASHKSIRKIKLSAPTLVSRFSSLVIDLDGAVAVDFEYIDEQKSYIYWSDVVAEVIMRTLVTDNVDEVVQHDTVVTHVTMSDGIAVDWVYKHLYWTDTGSNTIEVVNIDKEIEHLDSRIRRVIVGKNLDEPRALALLPESGWMFYSDWGENPQIVRCGMDGSSCSTIVNEDIQWPNGLTIDYDSVTPLLYWIDAKMHLIGSSKIDGSERRIVLDSPINIQHPFSITVFEDNLYWTDWSADSIRSINKFNGSSYRTLGTDLRVPNDITVLHQFRQPQPAKDTNPCLINRGGCPHFCLRPPQIDSTSPQFVCLCADGFVSSNNGHICTSTDNDNTTTKPSKPEANINRPYKTHNTTNSHNDISDGTSVAPIIPSTSTKTPPIVTVPSHTDDNRTKKTMVSTTSTTVDNRTTRLPVVIIPGNATEPPYNVATGNNTTQENLVKHSSEASHAVGAITGIVIGIIVFLITCIALIVFLIHKRNCRRNQKSMNFDNPVYKKTTDQLIIRTTSNTSIASSRQPMITRQCSNELV